MVKSTFNSWAVGLCAAGLFTGTLSVATADTIAFTPPVLNSFGGEPTGNDGEFFTPTISIWVTALGYVFPGSSPGNAVGLYDVSTTTLLASTTITSSSTLSGNFLYQTIAPVLLTAGNEYAVAGLYTAGMGALGYTADSGVGTAPEITFDGYKYDSSSSLDLPTISYATPIFGPNFQYVPVPEPTTMTIIIAGAFLLLVRWQRQEQSGLNRLRLKWCSLRRLSSGLSFVVVAAMCLRVTSTNSCRSSAPAGG